MRRSTLVILLAIAVAAVAIALYLLLRAQAPQRPPEPPAAPPVVQAPGPTPVPGEQAAFPVPEEKVPAEPMPPLDQSDPVLREAMAGLVEDRTVDELFNLTDIARRIAATVDNLPREKASPRLLPVKPPAGRFSASGSDEAATLSDENYARYAAQVRLLTSIDTERLVAMYLRFYPLLQEAYRELGYPAGHFNDRVIQAIDSMLAAPTPEGPVRLVRPKVMYQFADPALEALPAGQKMLIRMGPENAARVKAKLRDVRARLVALGRPDAKPAERKPEPPAGKQG